MRAIRCMRNGMACAVAMMVFTSFAAAQSLQQVPDGPMLLVKVNNPQNVSQKLGAMSQRLGLAAMEPALANPLSILKQQTGLQQGVNDAGEVVFALYEPVPGQGREPRPYILIPVSDYKAFIGNFQGAARDGNLDQVRLPGAPMAFFAAQFGQYAALSPDRNLVANAPAGLKVPGAVGKALTERDATLFLNMPVIAKMALPQIRMIKGFMANAPAAGREQAMGMAMAGQVLGGMEQFLTDSRAAAISMSFTDAGVTSTFIGDFTEGTNIANAIGGMKNTADVLLSGLPQGQYLAVAGWAQGGEGMWNFFDAMYGPVVKQANLPAEDAKVVQSYMDATKRFMLAMNGGSAALVAPQANAQNNAGLLSGFFVFNGDAPTMISANKTVLEGQNAFMKAMGQEGVQAKTAHTAGAKQVDGTKFDEYTMQFVIDANTPQGEMMQQVFNVLYGPKITGYIGALTDKKLLSAINVSEEQLQKAVAAAKQDAKGMADEAGVKAASAGLPAQRVAVAYVSIDRIATAVMDLAKRMGGQPPAIKFPQDMAPMGASLSSEGSAIRIDFSMPNSMIDGLVGAGMQAYMAQQMQRN